MQHVQRRSADRRFIPWLIRTIESDGMAFFVRWFAFGMYWAVAGVVLAVLVKEYV